MTRTFLVSNSHPNNPQVMAMGISEARAVEALLACGGDVVDAVDYAVEEVLRLELTTPLRRYYG